MKQHTAFHTTRWLYGAVIVGVFYALVGVTFAIPTSHARAWRLATWVVCCIVFAGYVVFERVALFSSVRTSAIHGAVAAGVGSLGLAVAANIHSLSVQSSAEQRDLLLIALVVWPLITAVPAFLVAYVLGGALSFLRPKLRDTSSEA